MTQGNTAFRKAPDAIGFWTPRQLDHLDALVAACALVAHADGAVTPDERARMVERMRAQSRLAPFGVDDVLEAFEALDACFEARPEEAAAEAEQMIRRLRGRGEALEVAAAATAVAIADGEFAAEEHQAAMEVCRWLEIDPARVAPLASAG